MNKQRLEAFSDGVLAIAITLLVLDIKVPHVEYSELPSTLLHAVPNIFSYLVSFAIIGVYWVGHNYYFTWVKKTDGTFTWLNILLLLLISFIPFPTSLLGEYPFQQIPVTIYGLNLLAVNIVSFIMILYVYYNRELATEDFGREQKLRFVRLFAIINLIYLAAIGISFFAPKISYAIYILSLTYLIWVYTDRGNRHPASKNY